MAWRDDDAHLGRAQCQDVAIAHGTVAREAKAQKKRFSAHAAHLAAHGVLHLLGHDHENDRDARAMERLEVEILAGLGLPDPYIEQDAKR